MRVAVIDEISRQLIPTMAATFLVVILITYIPALPMALVWLLRQSKVSLKCM